MALRLVALDTGPLGILTHPKGTIVADSCLEWLDELLSQQVVIVLPEIADYELRREYVLRRNLASQRRLNALAQTLFYLPISTTALHQAAHLWAQVRQMGQPTSHPKALDADCILVAQVQIEAAKFDLNRDEWVIATSDIGDLPRLAPAKRWDEIRI